MKLLALLLICLLGIYDSFPLKTSIQTIQQQLLSQEQRFKLFNRARVDSVIQMQNIDELIKHGPIPVHERTYLINGWRWHTLSVIHDLKRLISILEMTKLDQQIEENAIVRIQKCYNFVYQFNWNALKRVETNVFFPWLKSVLPPTVSKSVDKISAIHKRIEKLGDSFLQDFDRLKSSHDSSGNYLNSLTATLEQMIGCLEQIKSLQSEVFVPLISSFVSTKEQERFNRKVINGLGIVNSQIHLVSMYEAVKENPKELSEFRNQVPRIAQYTIPYWKKLLYDPKAKLLEQQNRTIVN